MDGCVLHIMLKIFENFIDLNTHAMKHFIFHVLITKCTKFCMVVAVFSCKVIAYNTILGIINGKKCTYQKTTNTVSV